MVTHSIDTQIEEGLSRNTRSREMAVFCREISITELIFRKHEIYQIQVGKINYISSIFKICL